MSNLDRNKSRLALPVGHPEQDNGVLVSQADREERQVAIKKLNTLVQKAESGGEEAVPEIRKILDNNPDLAWHFINGAGKLAESALLEAFTKDGDLAARGLLRHQLESMRIEVAGHNASPLERLLAERVVVTWFEVQLFTGILAKGLKSGTSTHDEFRQKRLDRAQRRHLSAVKTLAQIRKMGPALQINIAEKQINNVN